MDDLTYDILEFPAVDSIRINHDIMHEITLHLPVIDISYLCVCKHWFEFFAGKVFRGAVVEYRSNDIIRRVKNLRTDPIIYKFTRTIFEWDGSCTHIQIRQNMQSYDNTTIPICVNITIQDVVSVSDLDSDVEFTVGTDKYQIVRFMNTARLMTNNNTDFDFDIIENYNDAGVIVPIFDLNVWGTLLIDIIAGKNLAPVREACVRMWENYQ